MPKRGKMQLRGRMYVLCPAPIEKCSTVNRTCVLCRGSHALVMQKDARGRIVFGPAATDPLKFPQVQTAVRIQDAFSERTEWGQRHVDGKVYRKPRWRK